MSIYSSLFFSQDIGFLGKKNVLDLNVNLSLPLFYCLNNNQIYVVKNDELVLKKIDLIDYGLRMSYSRTLKRNLGLGLQMGYDFFTAKINSIFNEKYKDVFSADNKHQEQLKLRSFVINPNIQIPTKNGMHPIGVTHEFGFSFQIISLSKLEYLSEKYNYYNDSIKPKYYTIDYNNYFDKTHKNRFFVNSVNYNLNLRYPLSKSILLKFGINYSFNWLKKKYTEVSENSYMEKINSTIENEIFDKKLKSILLFNLGLSKVF